MPIFVQIFENNLALQLNIMGSFLPFSLDCWNCLGEYNERHCIATHLGTFNMTEETRPSPLRVWLSRSHYTSCNPLHLENALSGDLLCWITAGLSRYIRGFCPHPETAMFPGTVRFRNCKERKGSGNSPYPLLFLSLASFSCSHRHPLS